MSRVCVACGLGVDVDGNLKVNVTGVAGDVAPITGICTVASGTHIYCDPVTGNIYGEPEKFFRALRFGKNLVPNTPTDPTTIAPADNAQHDYGTPIILTFTNPSPCRPMKLLIESGISHCRLDHSGGGDFEIEVGTRLAVAGIPTADTGHQIWRHKDATAADAGAFDSMGARAYSNQVIVAPGATVLPTLQGWMRLTSATGSCTIQNWTIDLIYSAWND